MLRTNDAVSNAFQLLASTVRDFYSNGRPCLGAALKPELYRRASFSEQLIGFARFSDFLKAASAQGHVQLAGSPGGDIEVWPVGISIPERVPRQTGLFGHLPSRVGVWPLRSTAPIRIRQDLWNAFNSFSAGWVYNPAADIAYKDANASKLGDSIARSVPPGLIEIPAGRDRVLDWMRSFTNMQDAETRAQLATTLNGDTAVFQFNNFVRSNPRLLRAWGRFHVQQVLAAIEAWAASNNLKPKDVTNPAWSAQPPMFQASAATPIVPPIAPVAPSTPQPASWPLTGRLESLIDDLIGELIKLRGFLTVVAPKQ